MVHDLTIMIRVNIIHVQKGENMTNTLELNVAIVRSGLTKKEISKMIGLSEQGFQLKINNKTEFKASEIEALCKILKLKDKSIFFAN